MTDKELEQEYMMEKLKGTLPGLLRYRNTSWRYTPELAGINDIISLASNRGFSRDQFGPGAVELRDETLEEYKARKQQQ